MLVLDGRPVELEAHLERLATSLEALFSAAPPAGTQADVLARARSVHHGKLRLTVAPGRDGQMATEIATTEVGRAEVFPSRERGISLRSFIVEGGLGAHKWADRQLLDRAAAKTLPGEVTLLVDADGAALEASRGSVFLARRGQLVTPPTDGRILPSIARRQALEVARAEGIETHEERLTLDDLRGGGDVFLAGSVRGIEPVRSLDGTDLTPQGEISPRIASGLRRRWLRVPQAEPVAVVVAGRRAGPPAR